MEKRNPVPSKKNQGWACVLVILFGLGVVGCDAGDETNPSDTASQDTHADATAEPDDATQLGETVGALPYRGSVAVGEYEQPGLTGVTLYGVFAQTEDLEAPYDETIGACRLRYVASGEKIPEPVGVEVGEITIGGTGATETITLDSYDLGERHGGVAYSLIPEDLPKTIFNDTGAITITVTGAEPVPPLTLDIMAPLALVDFSPALDDLPADLSQDIEFTWTPAGADAVLVELDATAPDGSATQLRCRFEDVGSGVVSAAALANFQDVSYFGGAVRLNEQTIESGQTKLTGVLSRRQVVFVF